MLPAPVKQYLDAHREQQLEKFFELVRIPSIANRNDGQCLQAAQWLVKFLSDLGVQAKIVQVNTPAGKGQPVVLAHAQASPSAPTVLIYGHYDVQPPEPLELWESAPFEPVVRDGAIYARGANDDKGQMFTHLMALEAYVRTGTPLPVNITLLLEGEEENGSPTLEEFIRTHAAELHADATLVSDSEFFAPGVPAITYALRGVSHYELIVEEADHDVHSGLNGGALRNPIHVLAEMIAGLHDADGRITLEGFYDGVLPLSDAQRDAWKKLPFDEPEYARSLGVDFLGGGEKGFTVLERLWARPTLDMNGMIGGYTGPGGKTIIPARASAKISIRTVPNQDPVKIAGALEKYIRDRTPKGMKSTLEVGSLNRPVMLKMDSPAMRAGRNALKFAFGAEAAMIRCGASVPVTEMLQRLLAQEAVMMGFGLPDDRLHSPNERFRLEQFYNGAVAAAAVLAELGK